MSQFLLYFICDGEIILQKELNLTLFVGDTVNLPIKGESGSQDYVVKKVRHLICPEQLNEVDVKKPEDKKQSYIAHIDVSLAD